MFIYIERDVYTNSTIHRTEEQMDEGALCMVIHELQLLVPHCGSCVSSWWVSESHC